MDKQKARDRASIALAIALVSSAAFLRGCDKKEKQNLIIRKENPTINPKSKGI